MLWRRTCAYYTAKLTFCHKFPVEVSVRIIFKFVRYACMYGHSKYCVCHADHSHHYHFILQTFQTFFVTPSTHWKEYWQTNTVCQCAL